MSSVNLSTQQIKKGLALLVAFIVLRAILTYTTGANGETQTTWHRILFLGGGFLILSVGLTYFGFTRWVGVDLHHWWRYDRKRLAGDIGWGFLGFILCFFVNIGFVLLASGFGLIPQEAVTAQPARLSFLDWFLNLFFGFAIAGFQEETIFRGFLMDALQKRFSLAWSVIIQALVFSLAHIGYLPLERWILFANVFAFGLLFGVLRVKRNSLIAAWIAHGLAG